MGVTGSRLRRLVLRDCNALLESRSGGLLNVSARCRVSSMGANVRTGCENGDRLGNGAFCRCCLVGNDQFCGDGRVDRLVENMIRRYGDYGVRAQAPRRLTELQCRWGRWDL